jgi:thioredoxin 2
MEEVLAFRCTSCGGINRLPTQALSKAPKCGRCKQPLDLTAHPADMSDDELDRLVASSPVPVLVDFWAPWCGPCRMVAPHLVQLAQDKAGKLIVAKVNTDQHQRTAQRLQVTGIPTLAVYKSGKLVLSQAGALMGPQLQAFVAPHLG